MEGFAVLRSGRPTRNRKKRFANRKIRVVGIALECLAGSGALK